MRGRSTPLILGFFLLAPGSPASRAAAERLDVRAVDHVQPNDNRHAGGTWDAGVLSLRLVAQTAMWHPDGEDAPGALMPAFAEEGDAAQIPGPLLRVPTGTPVRVTVRNELSDTLRVHGLYSRPLERPPETLALVVPPGERREARFRLDAPGTYFYWGTTMRRAVDYRTQEDAQLTGAIVVDTRGTPARCDRVFVIGMWTDTVHRSRVHRKRVLAVINGRSWPHTERLRSAVGDTVRWRIINASGDLHPMHLHGFFFRVDSRGDASRDTVYGPESRPLAVTENIGAGATMSLTWVPERPGNWLFHCHVPEHIGPRGSLGAELPSTAHGDQAAAGAHSDHGDARLGMNGLVMGVEVRPSSRSPTPTEARTGHDRRLRLIVHSNRGSTSAAPLYSYALAKGGAPVPADSGYVAGPTIELIRGESARILA